MFVPSFVCPLTRQEINKALLLVVEILVTGVAMVVYCNYSGNSSNSNNNIGATVNFCNYHYFSSIVFFMFGK